MTMSNIEGPFFRAGADGVLLEEFRALAETNRYHEHPVLIWLARFIVGSGSGPNKDSPLFELCHLVYAIDSLTGDGNPDGRVLFFLGLERVIPRTIRDQLGALRSALEVGPVCVEEDGVVIEYDASRFQVKFGRMPFLMALYEFLVSMEGFTYYEELSNIFNEITDGMRQVSIRPIKEATNKIASRLRKYRRAHMEWAANNEKFDRILPFLRERSEANDLIIDDAAILDFWVLHSQGKEFKGYKTVFDAFVTFRRALQIGSRTQATQQASVMGTDREAGEVDLEDQTYDLGAFGNWASPFPVLDANEVKEIKFFKGKSERKPLELLMHFGPDAVRLPLAFLRLETFAPIQTGITNDLQVKRGQASVERRITCADATPYEEVRELYVKLLEHVRDLEKATLHGIMKTRGDEGANVVQFPRSDASANENDDMGVIATEAHTAFKQLTRKGFEDITDESDERGDAFRLAAAALVSMAHVLQGMLEAAGRLDGDERGLGRLFEDDCRIFSAQFDKIYGKAR